jgi:hypothetical protein
MLADFNSVLIAPLALTSHLYSVTLRNKEAMMGGPLSLPSLYRCRTCRPVLAFSVRFVSTCAALFSLASNSLRPNLFFYLLCYRP